MPPIISELIKFTVAPGFERNFAQLRKAVVSNGVKEQYYGTCTDTPNTLLWVIRAYSSFKFLFLERSLILNERMA